MSRFSHTAAVLAALGWTAGWSLAGWLLSAVGCLTVTSVMLATVPVGALAWYAWNSGRTTGRAGGWIRGTRFRRGGWAAAYAGLFVLVAVGGLRAEPANFDALTYRFPRLFHWVAAGGWHWIDSPDLRLNFSGTVSEWLLLPGWTLFHELRWVVLGNLAAFALLPGLLFSVLHRLGVNGRVARIWMWVLPAGYGYLLQAGSAGNDLLGAAFFLAALDLALRGRTQPRLLAGSVVAMALATGVKLSNLPLLLPWVVAVWPARRAFGRRPVVAALLVGLAVSALPTLVLNRVKSGDFAGDPANRGGLKPGSPVAALAGNAVAAGVQNLAPPVWPAAARWNAWAERAGSTRLAWIKAGLPRFTLRTGELAQEEWSGLGLPVLVLLALALPGGRRPAPAVPARVPWAGVIAAAAAGALLGSETPARLLLPYYPLLIALGLRRVDARGFMAGAVWRWTAGGAFLLAGLVVVLNPARPLWPWRAGLEQLSALRPGSPLLQRARQVYTLYARRSDCLAPLRPAWPAGEKRIGFAGGVDDSEVSLWRPFGKVEVVTATTLAPLGPGTGVRFIVVRMDGIAPALAAELAQAGDRGELTRVQDSRIAVKAAEPVPEHWAVWRWARP